MPKARPVRKRSLAAMLGMGIDTQLAQALISRGETLASLRRRTRTKLLELGLLPQQADDVLDGDRPPIPEEVVHQVLHESRSSCVVCRGQNKSIVIHHIVSWAKTRAHEIENLVVLCLEHHGEAHTRRELSRNLSPADLRKQKELWLAKVKELDVARVLQLGMLSDEIWDYFNFARISVLFDAADVEPSDFTYYRNLLSEGLVDEEGSLRIEPRSEVEFPGFRG